MAYSVACDGPKCIANAVANWGSTSYYGTSTTMDKKLWPSCKVCDYTFNFMAMSRPL